MCPPAGPSRQQRQHSPALNPARGAAAASPPAAAACCSCCWGGKHDVSIPLLAFRKINSVRATKTPSYVMTRRTNSECSWAAERRTGIGGRDVAASRRRRDARMGEHGAAVLPSAEPFCSPLTHSSFPGTLHRGHGALSYAGVTVQRRAGLWCDALIVPVSPRCSSLVSLPGLCPLTELHLTASAQRSSSSAE